MKIKRYKTKVNLWSKLYLNKISKKKVIVLIIPFMLFTLFSIYLIYFGAFLQKNQVAASINQILFDGAKTKFQVVPNYFKGLFSSPPKINIDIKFEDIQKLNFARHNAMKRGRIDESEKSIKVSAKLKYDAKIYDIIINPTGTNLDMIGNYNKQAYKIKVKNDKRIFGMKEFKLLPPHSRHSVVEWVCHQLEKNEGLISLKYDFIQVSINGQKNGIFAIEEHFNTELLERNRSREGIIFYFSHTDEIIVYNENKVIKTEKFRDQLDLLQNKWQAFINGDVKVDYVFDIDKYAKFYSLIDLVGGVHALHNRNNKMYFNPITNLIEPIGREYNSLRYSDGPIITPLLIELNTKEPLDVFPPQHLFFVQNRSFVMMYLENLNRLTKKNYLDSFFSNIESQLNDKLNIIFKDYPFYRFPKEFLYLRREQIQGKLVKVTDIKSYFNTDINNSFQFQIINSENLPIVLDNITYHDSIFYTFNNKILFDTLEIKINGLRFNRYGKYTLHYNVLGFDLNKMHSILIPKSFKNGDVFSGYLTMEYPNINSNAYLTIDEQNRSIHFKNSPVIIDENLIIPKNYTVYGKPGLEIILNNKASILSYSPLVLKGSKEDPIIIHSIDNNGQGIFINNSENKSEFYNINFMNISNPKNFGWDLTGAITVYESDIIVKNCTFSNNMSEDFLNIIKSNYEIEGSKFERIYSDAIDSDFSKGILTNCIFSNLGNDAIDISGSKLYIEDIYIEDAADKGISAGENSVLMGKNINIKNSEIGITSKDLSKVKLNKITLNNTKIGFTAYQKKSEYGPGIIISNEYQFSNVANEFLIEKGSSMMGNGKNLKTTERKVEEMLYGSIYGKKSN